MADQLQNNPRANPELAQQAKDLAQKQQQVAQQMEQLGQQPGAANAAQQQRQQELNNAAGQLGQQLAESQNKLGQQPLNLPQPAEGAKQAGQQAANSQQKMEAAKQASQQGNANQAAQAAEQAAENLQKAAEQAQAAAEKSRPPQSPVPRGVGEEVADAAERLRQAAQTQSAGNQPSQQTAQSNDGQPMPNAQPGQPNDPGQPGSKDGQAPGLPFAQMAQRLREAARALSDAANQSAPLPSQAGQPQPGQPLNEPNDNPQLAQGGGGSGQGNKEQDRGENLSDLQTQVKKMTGRNWGQLSSKLKTELSQQAKHQAHGDYSKLIKLYFQEIAKTQPDAAEGKR